MSENYEKCSHYNENWHDIKMLYGHCDIYGYCIIKANLIVDCEYNKGLEI